MGNVYTSYTCDSDSRLTGLTYSNTATQTDYGNLTYSYNADSEMYDEGGSLAAVGTPASATATYSSIDQVATWNGVATQVDKKGNILSDPTNGETYAWGPRNRLETVSGVTGKNSPILYDNKGRRENLPNSSGEQQYSYEGNQVIQTNGTATTNYLRMPGGQMLMASPSGSDAEIR